MDADSLEKLNAIVERRDSIFEFKILNLDDATGIFGHWSPSHDLDAGIQVVQFNPGGSCIGSPDYWKTSEASSD